MVKCSRCGLEFEDGLDLCPNCGNDLQVNGKKDNSQKCESCGGILKEGVAFCPTCGAKVTNYTQPEIKVKKCQKCGEELEVDSDFCPKCGAKVTNYTRPEIKVKKCQKCGEELEVDSDFCPECGSAVNAVKKTPPKNISENIFFVKVITFSLITTVVVTILSIIFLVIMKSSLSLSNVPYFPLAFYLAIFLAVGFFAALQKNHIEAIILSFIVGLLMAILEGFVVSLVFSSFGYGLVFGYHPIEFIVFSIVIGFVSNYLLKDYFSRYINIEALF